MIEYVITECWNGRGQAWQISKHTTTENTGEVMYLNTFPDQAEATRWLRFHVMGPSVIRYDENGQLKPQKSATDEIPF